MREEELSAPLAVWGRALIDEEPFAQIRAAARLPVTVRVALMPDAHVGYGLPIGGVAALEGAIAPYMVGVDIGCRLHATILSRNPIHLQQDRKGYQNLLMEHAYFGRMAAPKHIRAKTEHPILDDPRWGLLPRHLRHLRELAVEQLGSSGSGNHFVEWVKLQVKDENQYQLDNGMYTTLLSHSGSRGVGYQIAKYYSSVAEQVCSFLPDELRKLAYFDYRSEIGASYEMAMSLAGDFAKANHEILHQRIIDALGAEVLATVQNHHNYAWRIEQVDGAPIFVHRKGATPADKGVAGIIPGSMAANGFFVTGRCAEADQILEHPALNSASHGCGRLLGRRQAIKKLDAKEVRRFLAKKGVTLIGGGLDEAPAAYKDPYEVIGAQSDLVDVWAEFSPVIVRMAGGKKSLGNWR